jgi:hypothetical protein
LESLERRTVLSTVSGVSAADAAVEVDSPVEPSPAVVAGQDTQPSVVDALFISTHCPAGTTSLVDWSQALFEEETAEEKLEGIKEKLDEFEQELEELEKKWKELGPKYQDANENDNDEELRKLKPQIDEVVERVEKIKEEVGSIEDEIKEIEKALGQDADKDEIKALKDKIESLKGKIKDLEEAGARDSDEADQDGDAIPDNPPADDASDLGSLIPGSTLDLCLNPSAWNALAAANWGDGGTGHLDMFTASVDWDAIAAALSAQYSAAGTGDSIDQALDAVPPYDLSSLDNDTGAIDFVRWGAVDVPSNTDPGSFTAGDMVILGNGFRVFVGASLIIEIDRELYPDAWVQDDTPDGETVYSNLDNDTGAIDFSGPGWVEPPPDLLPLWR